jgi:hypothetical protein
VIVTDFELLLHELDRMPELIHRSRMYALLRSFSGRRMRIDGRVFRRMERLQVAGGMLASGMDRLEAAQALQERLGVSSTTARRLVSKAQAVRSGQ